MGCQQPGSPRQTSCEGLKVIFKQHWAVCKRLVGQPVVLPVMVSPVWSQEGPHGALRCLKMLVTSNIDKSTGSKTFWALSGLLLLLIHKLQVLGSSLKVCGSTAGTCLSAGPFVASVQEPVKSGEVYFRNWHDVGGKPHGQVPAAGAYARLIAITA
jgi:hypothetical protein